MSFLVSHEKPRKLFLGVKENTVLEFPMEIVYPSNSGIN